jgi:hypothetical protein
MRKLEQSGKQNENYDVSRAKLPSDLSSIKNTIDKFNT